MRNKKRFSALMLSGVVLSASIISTTAIACANSGPKQGLLIIPGQQNNNQNYSNNKNKNKKKSKEISAHPLDNNQQSNLVREKNNKESDDTLAHPLDRNNLNNEQSANKQNNLSAQETNEKQEILAQDNSHQNQTSTIKKETIAEPNKQINQRVYEFKDVPIKPNQSINYLAVGDSITAGYNGEIGYDLRGEMKENKSIRGLSFPAFLANYLNLIDNNRVTNFVNLGLTGSKVVDWLYFLNKADNSYLNSLNSKTNFFQNLKQRDNDSKALYRNKLNHYFKDFGINSSNQSQRGNNYNKEHFNGLIQAIKEANLMTITLGANDFMPKINFNLLKEIISQQNKQQKELLLQQLKNQLQEAGKIVQSNLEKLITALKEINPNLNINLVGYPMPLLRLQNVINEYAKLQNKSLGQEILAILNGAIKQAAKNSNINYLAVNDEDDWKTNNDQFAKAIFDIHPTEYGYKKMAQDIVLKLSLGEEYSSNKNASLANQLVQSWDQSYFNKDSGSFKQIIGFRQSNLEIIQKVLGSKNNELLFKPNDLQLDQEVRNIFKDKSNATKLLKSWIIQYLDSLIRLVPQLSSLINSLQNQQTNSNITKNLGREVLEYIILKTDTIDKVIINLQNHLDNNDLDHNFKKGTQTISSNMLINYLKNNLLNERVLFNVVRTIATNSPFAKDKNKLQIILGSLLKQFLTIQKAKELVDKHTNQLSGIGGKFVNLIKPQLFKPENFDKIVNFFIKKLADNPQHYFNKSNSFSKLIEVLLTENQDEIKGVLARTFLGGLGSGIVNFFKPKWLKL